MSREDDVKGRIAEGQYADFAALSADYFTVPDAEIRHIVSVLTVVDGKIVYGAEEFANLSPPLPPASPDWSPVRSYGGFAPEPAPAGVGSRSAHRCTSGGDGGARATAPGRAALESLWGPLGCGCWAY